jgi:hypothetical protein
MADPIDVVAPDCETVGRGGVPAGSGTDGGVRARCVVPKLRGLKVKKAKARLRRARCTAKVRRKASRVKRGRVIRQSAKAGRRLAAGARVTITVSRGRS